MKQAALHAGIGHVWPSAWDILLILHQVVPYCPMTCQELSIGMAKKPNTLHSLLISARKTCAQARRSVSQRATQKSPSASSFSFVAAQQRRPTTT